MCVFCWPDLHGQQPDPVIRRGIGNRTRYDRTAMAAGIYPNRSPAYNRYAVEEMPNAEPAKSEGCDVFDQVRSASLKWKGPPLTDQDGDLETASPHE